MKETKTDLYNILSHSNNASMSIYDTEIINKYILAYGQQKNISTPHNSNLKSILSFWNKNKQYIFNLLGGKIIYQFPIEIPIPEDRQIEAMKNALKELNGYQLRKDFYTICEACPDYQDLYIAILEGFKAKNLIKNIWNFGNFDFTFEKRPVKIFNGMKITTVFKKLSEIFKCTSYEQFRLAQSQGCNLPPSEGVAYLSIHPLDFFTLAENECGWDTCLSWKKEGGNCLGSVEMLNSTTAVVAYIKSKTDMDIPGGKWNNKKWREIFFVHEDFIIEGKAYPYRQDQLSLQIINKLKALSGCQGGQREVISYNDINKDESIINFTTKHNYMFNDFRYILPDSFHPQKRGHYSYFNDNFDFSDLSIDLSGETNCLWCGKEINSKNQITGQPSNIFCPDCLKATAVCSCCGKKCFNNSVLELEYNEEIYCEDCMMANCFTDAINFNLWKKADGMTIFLFTESNSTPEKCKSIEILSISSKYNYMRGYSIKKYFHTIHKKEVDNQTIYYIYDKDLTNDGKPLFY